ncbi:MAG: hypothetical protein K0Q68_2581 [Moraxellaceae bacterium]|nr:hypothetical protein [Moraxellaceae bacterium]
MLAGCQKFTVKAGARLWRRSIVLGLLVLAAQPLPAATPAPVVPLPGLAPAAQGTAVTGVAAAAAPNPLPVLASEATPPAAPASPATAAVVGAALAGTPPEAQPSVPLPVLPLPDVLAEPRLPGADSGADDLLFPEEAAPLPAEAGPNAPPRLLSPRTRPDRPRRPLLVAPVLSPREPIPSVGAGNCLRRDKRGRFMGWMDHQQCVFSGRALITARWIDDFFGDWHDDEATMMARLVAHTVVTEAEGYETKLTLRASATLPNARRRLRLIITDETDDDATGQDLRRQLGQDDSRLSAALRWMSLEEGGLESNLDVGARGIDPTDLFVRYRLRKQWNLTDDSIARLSQTLRYGSDSKERYTPVLDLERALDNRSVLRLSNYYDYRYESSSDGFHWSHAASFSRALHNSRSYSYGISLNGQTRPEWRGESYGPWFIYRSPFLRPWLYFEVEPHYTWYRERDWEGLASLLVRVEMQFGWRK